MTVSLSERDKTAMNGIGVAAFAACVALAPMVNAVYNDRFDTVRLLYVLLSLLSLYVLVQPKIEFGRECVLYAVLIVYMVLSLLWTPNSFLGLNTLVPALNFLLIMLLFGSLLAHTDVRAVLRGYLAGFLVGAVAYTYLEGFPFIYPRGFSYNAGAAMYLFGLFITLLFAWHTSSKAFALCLGSILLLHIAATTSIKTNLGVLLGVLSAAVFFFGRFSQIIFRNAGYVVAVIGLFVYAAASSGAVIERVQAGFDRVSLGIAALEAREDITGSTSINLRQYWAAKGLEGWAANPVFGHGVEAFRADHGITSHSTPIDLLYNTGLIGFLLFNAMFASIAWRIYMARRIDSGYLRPLIFGALTCYFFMTLSGTMLYQSFLAAFFALSSVLLSRQRASVPN